jgi:hypothetical protein
VSEIRPNEELIEVVNYRRGTLLLFIFFSKMSSALLGWKISSEVWCQFTKKAKVKVVFMRGHTQADFFVLINLLK